MVDYVLQRKFLLHHLAQSIIKKTMRKRQNKIHTIPFKFCTHNLTTSWVVNWPNGHLEITLNSSCGLFIRFKPRVIESERKAHIFDFVLVLRTKIHNIMSRRLLWGHNKWSNTRRRQRLCQLPPSQSRQVRRSRPLWIWRGARRR